MKVVTVGEPTYGKPFFMTPIKCGSVVLELINGIGSNANGETVPESGIRQDYLVKDDLKHQLGDSREALLKKALEILGDFSLRTYLFLPIDRRYLITSLGGSAQTFELSPLRGAKKEVMIKFVVLFDGVTLYLFIRIVIRQAGV